jgi:hypothetical protein
VTYVTLTPSTIGVEHICCAFSDAKCADGYARKKRWLTEAFDDGYVFRNTEFHVRESLTETAGKRGLPLTVIKLETMEQAQAAPTPATIFSLFRDGRFVTTDVGVCLDSRFDRIAG